ncbi:MAG: signal recognition particle protein [Euryarchaeota archaeon]|nr:signal recognition particle protein [Euryarchaeota archaeon]
MVLEKLGGSLRDIIRRVANAGNVDQSLIREVVKEIQRALLQADVNVQLALKLSKEVERRALSEKPKAGMSSREQVIHIIYEELVHILGSSRELQKGRQVIMMVGLYGQGKTTTAGKLARHFKKKGLNVALVAADVHRPAAYDQLMQIGELIQVPVYGIPGEKKAAKVASAGLKQFAKEDVVIVDTSGRHALEDDLIKELKDVAAIVQPTERILVIDAAVGQQAGPQAKAFHDAVAISGVIVTKLDGSAKGGGAISAVSETKAPILFIGTGEHVEDIEPFMPDRFISRLLGMGDLSSLIEKAREVVDEKKAEETMKGIMAGRFTLKDMREQMEMLTNMGPLQKVMGMIPGFSGKLTDEQLAETQERLRKFKVIMASMTDAEMKDPKMLKGSRITRIARGAGVEPSEVRGMLHQYNLSKKQMKGVLSNRKIRRQMLKQMGEKGS